jgi:predicted aconitase
MMQLSDREKAMLDGARGKTVSMFMNMLVTLGNIYGAERLIPVQSAHASGLSVRTLGKAGTEWAEELARDGTRVSVPTTTNVVGIDRTRDLGLKAEWVEQQERIIRAYEAMGCYVTSSCVPYYHGVVPRFREHAAWGESSAVVFLNSVLGARNNREGGPSTLASAVTGRTPYYGLHLPGNRKGTLLCNVETALADLSDFGALGAFTAAHVGSGIPVFEGIASPPLESLVSLGASLASSGSVAMYHMVGVTPEAPDVQTALGGNTCETVVFGKRELAEYRAKISTGVDPDVDFVALGCPHCSLNQLAEIARLLDGKRIKDSVTLWVQTNISVRELARQLGYVDAIERAGGVVTQDMCVVLSRPEDLGFKSLATNSAKMAFYAPGSNKIPAWYGNLQQCLDAAVCGRWPAA